MDDVLSQWSEAIISSLATAMGLLFSAAPKILGFVFIVLIGWLLATLVEKGVAALLRTIRFNDLGERSGLANFVRKMGTESDPTGMIGAVTKWFIRLIALVVAFDALGLPAVVRTERAGGPTPRRRGDKRPHQRGWRWRGERVPAFPGESRPQPSLLAPCPP